MELCFPRFILPQFLNHRAFSRSSESSRARPVKSKIDEVLQSPVTPFFARNRKGMVAGEELPPEVQEQVRDCWLTAMGSAVQAAAKLSDLGVAKQWANRLLEPFAYVKLVVTATDWDNFFRLRIADDAQPEIQELARKMKAARQESEETYLRPGDWHLPYVPYYISVPTVGWETVKQASAARCARVSYTQFDGRSEYGKDLELAARLRKEQHSSPFEHQATPAPDRRYYGNLRGWVSYRYQLEQDGTLPHAGG